MTIASRAPVVRVQALVTTQHPSIILPHQVLLPALMGFSLPEDPSRRLSTGQGRIHNLTRWTISTVLYDPGPMQETQATPPFPPHNVHNVLAIQNLLVYPKFHVLPILLLLLLPCPLSTALRPGTESATFRQLPTYLHPCKHALQQMFVHKTSLPQILPPKPTRALITHIESSMNQRPLTAPHPPIPQYTTSTILTKLVRDLPGTLWIL